MPASWHGIIASVIASFVMAVFWVAPHALAEDDIDNDVILGALIAEFHISVAASLSSDALTAETPLSGETIIDAAQLIVLSGITDKPANANEADLGKALDAFLAFAATLDKEKLPPLSPKFATLLACQLIGADPIAHAALGATLKIDAKGAEACAEDFAQAIIKWNKRFAPYRRDADVTPPDGAGLLYVEIAPVIECLPPVIKKNHCVDGAMNNQKYYQKKTGETHDELFPDRRGKEEFPGHME